MEYPMSRQRRSTPFGIAAEVLADHMRQTKSCVDPRLEFGMDLPDAYSNAAVQESLGLGAELCRRPANILGGAVDHHWLKVGDVERGLGALDQGVPGHDSSPDVPWVHTAVNDHAGESLDPDATCEALPGVDPICVLDQVDEGPTGNRWYEQHCQEWAAEVADTCRKPAS
jgi:hypothetical protein